MDNTEPIIGPTEIRGASVVVKSVNFEFPYRPLPEVLDLSNVPPSPVRPMA